MFPVPVKQFHGMDLLPPVKIEYSLDDGINWNLLGDNVQGHSMLWNSLPNVNTIYGRIRVSSVTDPSQWRISNTFTITGKDKGSIIQQGGVNFVPYGIAWDGQVGLWTTSFYSNKLVKLNADNFVTQKEITLEGDSLFTDIAMDRNKGILYIHRMNSNRWFRWSNFSMRY